MSMSLGLGANLKLGASQKLTPQMQQAIRLLQMSSLELEQEIQIKLDENPLLEREEGGHDALDKAESLNEPSNIDSLNNSDSLTNSTHSTTATSESSHSDDGFGEGLNVENSFDKLSNNNLDDSAMDTNWDSVYTSAPASLVGVSDEELMGYQGGTSSNIQDHVRWQMNFKNLSETDNMIADYLIDSMEDSGFISLDIDELHTSLATIASFYQWESNIDKEEIIAVLKMIQSCEPLGIGARNLPECLGIQLKKLNKQTPYLDEAKKILDYSQYLTSNNISALLSETGIEIEDIQPALELIRTLNPAPGQTFTDAQPDYGLETNNYDIPDILVSVHHYEQNNIKNQNLKRNHTDNKKQHVHQPNNELTNDDNEINDNKSNDEQVIWDVRLNPDTLPKLKINQEYASLVKRGDDSHDNIFIKEKLTDAKLFLRSIEERNQNLLKVAICIVKRQESFLLHGATAMQPLILKEVAEEIGVHESTVSRLTTSKSALTPQGLFSLKHFFSSSVSGNEGDVSSTAICAMIKDLVENENPQKPLSDSAIVNHLNKKGIEIARRTVAKYREQLHIGSSTQRKKRY